jgi:plastocyanin
MSKTILRISVIIAAFAATTFAGISSASAQTTVTSSQTCASDEQVYVGVVIQATIAPELNTYLIQDLETGYVFVYECAGVELQVGDQVSYVKPKSGTKIIIRDIIRR